MAPANSTETHKNLVGMFNWGVKLC
jgi:hypothetical protein